MVFDLKRAEVLLKSSTKNFQNSPPFERLACFYLTTTENFEHFQYFEINFLKNENLFQKTGLPFFFGESTKIENATFPYKTTLSEANVETNRVGSTKWTYRKTTN